MRFAIAWRTNEQNTPFPGDTVLLVGGTSCEELRQVVMNILLETSPHNQVIESCTFNVLEEMLILVPAAAIKHQHLTPYRHVPLAHACQERIGDDLAIRQYPILEGSELSIWQVH